MFWPAVASFIAVEVAGVIIFGILLTAPLLMKEGVCPIDGGPCYLEWGYFVALGLILGSGIWALNLSARAEYKTVFWAPVVFLTCLLGMFARSPEELRFIAICGLGFALLKLAFLMRYGLRPKGTYD